MQKRFSGISNAADIYTIIVTYNGIKWIDLCLKSLQTSTIPVKVIVVDNNSSDGTPRKIKEDYNEVHLIESDENLGFGKANNIGIKYALENGTDYLFLLNQDAWIEDDTIERLVSASKNNQRFGIISPIHLNKKKTEIEYYFRSYLGNTDGLLSDLYFGKLKSLYETKFVNAAAWLITKDCIMATGGFDTSLFFHYGEDNNFCQRAIYHGFSIGLLPTATVCHDRPHGDDASKSAFYREADELRLKKRLADINISDDEVFQESKRILKNLRSAMLLNLISFDFKKFKHNYCNYSDFSNLFKKITISRKTNKGEGLKWLH